MIRSLFAIAILCFAAAGRAQDKLPAEMVGSATLTRKVSIIASWSVSIVSQKPSGETEGKMSLDGRACQFKDVPFTGNYRNGALDISVPQTSAHCEAMVISMQRSGLQGIAFEGTSGPFFVMLTAR